MGFFIWWEKSIIFLSYKSNNSCENAYNNVIFGLVMVFKIGKPVKAGILDFYWVFEILAPKFATFTTFWA